MSDPRVSSDWTEENIQEELVESEVALTEEDILEILNGQSQVLDRDEVKSLDQHELYTALIERYRQDGRRAYQKKMDVFEDDMEMWVPEDMDTDKMPAPAEEFTHEVSTNYSRAEDGLTKERTHYFVRHPETGDVIAHLMEDQYVQVTEADNDE